jgi:transportin-3
MAESFLETIVNSPGEGFGNLQTLELLLLIAGYHDYSVSVIDPLSPSCNVHSLMFQLIEMTFNVWYRLSEFVFQRNDESLHVIMRPYVERYIMCLHRHCRFDADIDGMPDAQDDFVEFRGKVTDTVKDVVFIVGTDRCLANVSNAN